MMRFSFLSLVGLPVAAIAMVAGCDAHVVVGGSGGPADQESNSGESGVLHASCAVLTPSPMPALPQINATAGRPNFDLWRDMDCNLVLGNLCGAAGDSSSCPGGKLSVCLQSDAAVGGVCTYGDGDIWCDGEGEAIGYGDGTCFMCAPIESHAAACCAALPGFDCRAWPFPGDGEAGTLCARHEDCEPGLLCGASQGSGYGICQCPGLDPSSITPGPSCGI